MERRFRLLAITTIFLALTVSLIICEITLRIIGYIPGIINPEMYEPNNNVLIPYKLKPDFIGNYVGKKVTIDSNGYRVVIPSINKNIYDLKGSKSLLLVGDSLIFGQGLEDHQTIPSIIQQKAYNKNIPIVVKNISAPGYTSWNEYEAFRLYLKNHIPDIVFVLYIPNDITYDNDSMKIKDGKIAHLKNDVFHNTTQWLYKNIILTYVISNTIKKIVRWNSDSLIHLYHIDKGKLAYSIEAITKMKYLCEEKDINFIVGIYRDIWVYDNYDDAIEFEKKVRNMMNKNKLNTFVIKAHTDNLSINSVRVAWNDPHPSYQAISLISDEIISIISPLLNMK